MGLLTLQDIFQRGSLDYAQAHPLPAHHRQAARAIMPCRPAALGGHVHACPDGHIRRIWYHSCRHRSCPQGSCMEIARWLAMQRARLLACAHSHVLFPIPHDRKALWLDTVPLMPTRLLQSVRDPLTTLLAAPQDLGAQPGSIAALHTWGQTLVLPPHIHGLVTGGGLPPDGQWQTVRNGCLLPVRVAMAVFRGKCLAALRTAWERGALQRPADVRSQQCLHLLNRLGHPQKTHWHVPIQERSPHGTGVATSLARDMRGGPSKHPRLVACDGETVTFRYVDNPARSPTTPAPQRQMTLPLGDFLQRVLQHVPLPGTQVVRSWGLYHPRQADALATCRAQLGQSPVVVPVRLAWQTVCAQQGEVHPECCPTCGQVLVCPGVIPRGGVAPPGRVAERAAGDGCLS